MHIHYTVAFAIAFISCLVLLRLLYPFAIRIRLVDKPCGRKVHEGEVPLIGGLAMFGGFVITLLIAAPELNLFRGLLLSATILIIVGALDDHHNMSVRQRLFFQIFVVLIMTSYSNVVVNDMGNLLGMGNIALAGWAIPFTVVAAVGSMNALNMTDGIDGLAGISSLVCFLAVFFLYSLSGETHLSEDIICKPLLFSAVLIPFIWMNLNKTTKVFMGDSGSMFLGFGVAWVLVEATQGEKAVMAPVTALWVFALPLIDMWSIMFRRMRKRQSPFRPDRDHLHHVFLRAGFSHRATVNILCLISMLLACVGIVGHVYQVPEWVMFLGFVFILAAYIWGMSYIWVVLKYVRQRSERHTV